MSTAGDDLELHTHALAVGGDAVGRDAEGRVVFVAGALADETVRVRVRSSKRRFAHADLVEVVEPSPLRTQPVCPHVERGCGGCGWAHLGLDAQRRAKVEMVIEAMTRIGKVEPPQVESGPALAPTGFRTTVRAAVVDGRGGFRRATSDDVLAVDSCRVTHPLVEEMLVEGRFGAADEVVLRVGARTGERLARVAPVSKDVVLPEDVMVVGADELDAGRRAWIHEEVAGVRFRVSADSFFQARPDGAEALVQAVADALEGIDAAAPMIDLYSGVGLFARTVGAGRPVVAVESSKSSSADAQINLADNEAKVIKVAVEQWRPSSAEIVVADPPRSGLGQRGVAKIDATGSHRLALVSCDAGSLGRDAGLLVHAGWSLDWARVIDMFPDTPHVEVVTRFSR